MTPFPCCTFIKLHKIIEHVKRVGFPLETDEVEDLEVGEILRRIYGISQALTPAERLALHDAFMALAEANEVREALVKLSEVQPEDHGVVHFRQMSHGLQSSAASYPVHFSYPVDANLRCIGRTGGASFSIAEKKPLEEGAVEVDEDE